MASSTDVEELYAATYWRLVVQLMPSAQRVAARGRGLATPQRPARASGQRRDRVWRAEASGGGFRRVYEATGPELSGAGLWTGDGVVYANGSGAAAVSEDGGLSWTTIRTWR